MIYLVIALAAVAVYALFATVQWVRATAGWARALRESDWWQEQAFYASDGWAEANHEALKIAGYRDIDHAETTAARERN